MNSNAFASSTLLLSCKLRQCQFFDRLRSRRRRRSRVFALNAETIEHVNNIHSYASMTSSSKKKTITIFNNDKVNNNKNNLRSFSRKKFLKCSYYIDVISQSTQDKILCLKQQNYHTSRNTQWQQQSTFLFVIFFSFLSTFISVLHQHLNLRNSYFDNVNFKYILFTSFD